MHAEITWITFPCVPQNWGIGLECQKKSSSDLYKLLSYKPLKAGKKRKIPSRLHPLGIMIIVVLPDIVIIIIIIIVTVILMALAVTVISSSGTKGRGRRVYERLRWGRAAGENTKREAHERARRRRFRCCEAAVRTKNVPRMFELNLTSTLPFFPLMSAWYSIHIIDNAELSIAHKCINYHCICDLNHLCYVTLCYCYCRSKKKREEEKRGSGAPRERVKKNEKELTNFYKFQIREQKQNKLFDLRKKFDEDREKVAQMKAGRKFKPFWCVMIEVSSFFFLNL